VRFLALLIATFISVVSPVACAEAWLHDEQDHSIAFSSLKGRWVFINYWASWCPGCVEEIPELNQFYAAHKDQVALFAVNYDGLPLWQQRRLMKEFKIKYPGLLQDPAQSLQLGDIRGIPVTFVFNPQGKLVTALYGGQTMDSLKKVLASQ